MQATRCVEYIRAGYNCHLNRTNKSVSFAIDFAKLCFSTINCLQTKLTLRVLCYSRIQHSTSTCILAATPKSCSECRYDTVHHLRVWLKFRNQQQKGEYDQIIRIHFLPSNWRRLFHYNGPTEYKIYGGFKILIADYSVVQSDYGRDSARSRGGCPVWYIHIRVCIREYVYLLIGFCAR